MASFTRSFEEAIAKAAALPPDYQDVLAALILAEIEAGRRWEERFGDDRSPILLERLAAEAIAEDEAGLTEPIEDLVAETDEDADELPDAGQ